MELLRWWLSKLLRTDFHFENDILSFEISFNEINLLSNIGAVNITLKTSCMIAV